MSSIIFIGITGLLVWLLIWVGWALRDIYEIEKRITLLDDRSGRLTSDGLDILKRLRTMELPWYRCLWDKRSRQ